MGLELDLNGSAGLGQARMRETEAGRTAQSREYAKLWLERWVSWRSVDRLLNPSHVLLRDTLPDSPEYLCQPSRLACDPWGTPKATGCKVSSSFLRRSEKSSRAVFLTIWSPGGHKVISGDIFIVIYWAGTQDVAASHTVTQDSPPQQRMAQPPVAMEPRLTAPGLIKPNAGFSVSWFFVSSGSI